LFSSCGCLAKVPHEAPSAPAGPPCDHETVTEEEVFQAIVDLVARGEPCDDRVQKLGPEPAPVRRLPDGRRDPVDVRRWRSEHPKILHFTRGTEEYDLARAAGLLEPLPVLVPAPADAVVEAEEVIGWPLPPLLRRLYLEVGNGGFGPRSGILGVKGGRPEADWPDIVEVHKAFSGHPRDPSPAPKWLVWIFDWGCTIWSMVDCRDPAGPMWFNEEGEIAPQGITLAEWLDRWVKGKLYLPTPWGQTRMSR